MTDRSIKNTEILKKSVKVKRIAYIFNHSYFLGGGEISLFELLKNLDRASFHPIAIIPKNGQIENKLKAHNINFNISPIPSIKYIFNGTPVISLLKLIKVLRLEKVEIIHANGSRAAFYAGLAGRILKIPVIWHVRETIQDYYCYDYLLGLLSSKIICVSKSVKKKRFNRFGSYIKKRIAVVYNGIDTQLFRIKYSARNRVRKELSLDNEILLGIVGNFVPLKGQNFFLKGFALALKKIPSLKVKVLLIGRPLNKSYYESLITLSKNLDIENKIIFKHYLPDIKDVLSALDVFVLPSKREGFSRSMLEAMSCGLPVIATKISEIEEAIVDNENGLLVDFMDLDRMAAAIITLCSNQSMRNKIGRTNRLLVNSKFRMNLHARAIESLYAKSDEGKL